MVRGWLWIAARDSEVEAGGYNAVTLGNILDLKDAWVTEDGLSRAGDRAG